MDDVKSSLLDIAFKATVRKPGAYYESRDSRKPHGTIKMHQGLLKIYNYLYFKLYVGQSVFGEMRDREEQWRFETEEWKVKYQEEKDLAEAARDKIRDLRSKIEQLAEEKSTIEARQQEQTEALQKQLTQQQRAHKSVQQNLDGTQDRLSEQIRSLKIQRVLLVLLLVGTAAAGVFTALR